MTTPGGEATYKERLRQCGIGAMFGVVRIFLLPGPMSLPLIVLFWLAYLGAAGIVAWPLHEYREIRGVSLNHAIGYSVVALFGAFVYMARGDSSIGIFLLLLGVPLTLFGMFVIPCSLLSLVALIRRRFWPIYPPGHCRRCGYNLTGLDRPRCPECGTSFAGESGRESF